MSMIKTNELRLSQLKRTFNLTYKALMECVILREIFVLNLKQLNNSKLKKNIKI